MYSVTARILIPKHSPRLRVSRFSDAATTTWSTGLIADGPLFQLAGGPARLALGLDHRNEQFDLVTNWEISTPGLNVSRAHNSRNVSAAFAELAFPLLAPHASGPDVPKLELSVAGRYDDYDDVGSTFNPRVGLSWLPFTALRVRGTWGTSFRAPPFYLSDEDIRLPAVSTTTLADPASPTGRTQALLTRGVSPDLTEETAEVWTAGLEITPINDLSVSLTYFDISYEDRIQTPTPIATILVFENHYEGTGVITRNPTQAQVDAFCSRPTRLAVVRSVQSLIHACATSPLLKLTGSIWRSSTLASRVWVSSASASPARTPSATSRLLPRTLPNSTSSTRMKTLWHCGSVETWAGALAVGT